MNESESADVESDTCDYCGTPVPDRWFGIEVQRPTPTTDGRASARDMNWENFIFCNQEHAALWMQTPLPALDLLAPDDDRVRRPWWDRTIGPLLVAALLVALAFAVVGAYTVVLWLVER